MAEKSKEFGVRLKELIKKKGLTQEKLAVLIEVTQSAISNYIRKGSIPEAPILYKLSKELGVSMEDLLIGETQNSSEVINFNRRREDIFFQKDPDLKTNLDLFVNLWQSGNPYVRDLFETGLKTAKKLIEKDPDPTKSNSPRKEKKRQKGGR